MDDDRMHKSLASMQKNKRLFPFLSRFRLKPESLYIGLVGFSAYMWKYRFFVRNWVYLLRRLAPLANLLNEASEISG